MLIKMHDLGSQWIRVWKGREQKAHISSNAWLIYTSKCVLLVKCILNLSPMMFSLQQNQNRVQSLLLTSTKFHLIINQENYLLTSYHRRNITTCRFKQKHVPLIIVIKENCYFCTILCYHILCIRLFCGLKTRK